MAGGDVLAIVTLTNKGKVTAEGVQITGAMLGSTNTTTLLPVHVGALQAGAVAAPVQVGFPAASALPGTSAVLRITGLYTGGSFGRSFRVVFRPITLTGASVTQTSGVPGSNLGDYEYRVTYTHPDGFAPAAVWLTILEPEGTTMGTWVMSKVNPDDVNYKDGCEYRFRPSVLSGGLGLYQFRVDASDGTFATPPATGTGPCVTNLDSGRIAFSSIREGGEGIFTMDAAGGSLMRLTVAPTPWDGWPSWSPDGTRLAFHRTAGVAEDIYVINADGSGCIRLTTHAARDTSPAWSPDGTRIAFTSDRDGNSEIYVMAADGSSQTRLTSSGSEDDQAAWSPDASHIVFQSARDGDLDIYVMDADGANVTKLTDNTAYDIHPAWSPDGSSIAFQSDRGGVWADIYTMRADGSDVRRLTSGSNHNSDPFWSPDGSRITFTSHRDQDWEIYIMLSDGGDQRRLTANPGTDAGPSWSAGPYPAWTRVAAGRRSGTLAGAQSLLLMRLVRDRDGPRSGS